MCNIFSDGPNEYTSQASLKTRVQTKECMLMWNDPPLLIFLKKKKEKQLSLKPKQGRKDTQTHICHMFAAL